MGKLFFVISILFIGISAISQTGKLAKKGKDPLYGELAAIRAANIKKADTTQFQYFIIKSDSTGMATLFMLMGICSYNKLRFLLYPVIEDLQTGKRQKSVQNW